MALIEHGANIGDLSAAIIATADVSGELLGEPSEEIRQRLADSEQPQLSTPYASM